MSPFVTVTNISATYVKLINIDIKMEIKVILAILVRLNWVKWWSGHEW